MREKRCPKKKKKRTNGPALRKGCSERHSSTSKIRERRPKGKKKLHAEEGGERIWRGR